MKKLIIAVAVICLFSSSAFAADYCDSKYMDLINKLKKTDKIFDDQKKKYIPSLEKALALCKENKMAEARIIMDELRDQFFQDALTNESQFFSHQHRLKLSYQHLLQFCGQRKKVYQAILDTISMGRLGETAETAHFTIALLDGYNMYTTGNFFPVARGFNNAGMEPFGAQQGGNCVRYARRMQSRRDNCGMLAHWISKRSGLQTRPLRHGKPEHFLPQREKAVKGGSSSPQLDMRKR